MIVPPLAHAGHWALDLAYATPVIALVITGLVVRRRDRRAEREEAARGEGPGGRPPQR
jgi:hypothetical protein